MPYANGDTSARQWTVDAVTRIIDTSFEERLNEILEAAKMAIVEGMGTGSTFEAYENATRNGDTYEYATAIGTYVVEILRDWIEEDLGPLTKDNEPNFWPTLVTELLDLSDRAQADMFGKHYLPTPDDLRTWFVKGYEGTFTDFLDKDADTDEDDE